MQKVLILGANGMLGHQACRTLSHHFDVWGTVRQMKPNYDFLPQDHILTYVDATDVETVEEALEHVQPAVVVNCIGIIKQIKEAKDPITSIFVNAMFPHMLARECTARRIRLIHISTDCVFLGTKGMYTEDDAPDALDMYGRTKQLGEVGEPYLTLRTSIIGHELDTQNGLLAWFLSQKGKTVSGFRKAIFSGLTTQALSKILVEIIQNHPRLSGLYHVSAAPIDKYSLLDMIRATLALDINIEPKDDPEIDRSLDSTRFRDITGWLPPSWQVMVEELA